MKKIFTTKYNIALILSGLILTFGFFIAKALSIPVISIPEQPYSFDTTLAQGIGKADTAMTLVLGTLKDGTLLSGYQCFTIDIGLSTAEYSCGTASSTSITSLVRGIPPLSPTSTVVSLEFPHRAGADVRITDFPGLQILKRLSNGQDPFPNPLLYDQAVSTTTQQTNPLYLVDYAMLTSVALQGSVNATTTTQGLVQFSTGTQLSAGTLQGSTGAYLVPQNVFFRSISQSATTVPVTLANGKLDQSFLDFTIPWTFTSTTTLSATSTIAANTTSRLFLNGVPYAWPVAQGAASTTLVNDGNGNLTFQPVFQYATSTTGLTNNTFSSTTATATISTLKYTPPLASRLMIIFTSSWGQNTGGDGCQVQLYTDTATTTPGFAFFQTTTNTAAGNLSFTYVTSQQTAVQHTYAVAGTTVTGGTCTVEPGGAQMSIINIGN